MSHCTICNQASSVIGGCLRTSRNLDRQQNTNSSVVKISDGNKTLNGSSINQSMKTNKPTTVQLQQQSNQIPTTNNNKVTKFSFLKTTSDRRSSAPSRMVGDFVAFDSIDTPNSVTIGKGLNLLELERMNKKQLQKRRKTSGGGMMSSLADNNDSKVSTTGIGLGALSSILGKRLLHN